MKTQAAPRKPHKKLSKKAATQKWLKTKAGQRWLAERIRVEADLEIAHELRKFCI